MFWSNSRLRCDLLSFYYLCRTGNNPWRESSRLTKCCDLLSFYYLCRTGNNSRLAHANPAFVVICFHFTIFVVLETTWNTPAAVECMLWFAFILLSLSYWKQHFPIRLTRFSCCDLLSFYYLCRTGNNRTGIYNSKWCVVICFHFTIFVVLETTEGKGREGMGALWFAFILLSLSYWKQHFYKSFVNIIGCDLLSFYYLCRTGNNAI